MRWNKRYDGTRESLTDRSHRPIQKHPKLQMDVKVVPRACTVGTDDEKFYQYTILEEASRKRFIKAYKEQSGYSTVDFVNEAIRFFGYRPKIIQTDNGSEFTNTRKTRRIHTFDLFCQARNIHHQLLRPRTPWHNGKVERSHRNDQERFYNGLKFYSYEDLQRQMRTYLYRSNLIPMRILGWKSPQERQNELLRGNPEVL